MDGSPGASAFGAMLAGVRDAEAPMAFPDELVGADSVRSGQLDEAAAFVVELLERPGG